MKNKDLGGKFGLTVPFMRDYGRKIWPMAKADSFIQEEMFMKESGLMIKQKAKEFIFIKMVPHIQANGLMTNSMVMELKNG